MSSTNDGIFSAVLKKIIIIIKNGGLKYMREQFKGQRVRFVLGF